MNPAIENPKKDGNAGEPESAYPQISSSSACAELALGVPPNYKQTGFRLHLKKMGFVA